MACLVVLTDGVAFKTWKAHEFVDRDERAVDPLVFEGNESLAGGVWNDNGNRIVSGHLPGELDLFTHPVRHPGLEIGPGWAKDHRIRFIGRARFAEHVAPELVSTDGEADLHDLVRFLPWRPGLRDRDGSLFHGADARSRKPGGKKQEGEHPDQRESARDSVRFHDGLLR